MKKNQVLYFVSRSLAKPSEAGENVDKVDKRRYTFPYREGGYGVSRRRMSFISKSNPALPQNTPALSQNAPVQCLTALSTLSKERVRTTSSRHAAGYGHSVHDFKERVSTLPLREGRLSRRLNRVSFVFASTLCLTLAFLSLFTLNYSSIFNLSTPTAHATDSSATDVSLDVPTTIAMSITGSNPQCAGDELDTSESAVPAVAQLCLEWSDDKTAAGTQTVSVRTNSPYGYSLHADTGASRVFNDAHDYLDFKCKLGDSDTCVYSRSDFSDSENNHIFTYTINSKKAKQQLTAGDYSGNISYTATTYSIWGDGESSTDDSGQTVYAFDYTGAYQKFIAPPKRASIRLKSGVRAGRAMAMNGMALAATPWVKRI